MLKEAAKHTKFEDIIIDREASTVFLRNPQMSVDVGAVAKGYATEQIAKSLIADGVSNYALNFGGNIRTIGTKNDGSDWSAAVTNPDNKSEKPYIMKVKLKDQAFVTSGSYERFYMVDGVRYHHIIDPKTLMPNNTFSSVSILADDSGLADVLSTALFNLTYDEGKALIEDMEGVEAVWVTSDNKLLYSTGFESVIVEMY
jgi:thiamine biosynthesis lipoprotein